VFAALIAEQAGADNITMHLREDRRHIQDRDIRAAREVLQTRLNFEMAATEEMVRIVCEVRPADCCLVPERRAEALKWSAHWEKQPNAPWVVKRLDVPGGTHSAYGGDAYRAAIRWLFGDGAAASNPAR
jgi:hypothetical protein